MFISCLFVAVKEIKYSKLRSLQLHDEACGGASNYRLREYRSPRELNSICISLMF